MASFSDQDQDNRVKQPESSAVNKEDCRVDQVKKLWPNYLQASLSNLMYWNPQFSIANFLYLTGEWWLACKKTEWSKEDRMVNSKSIDVSFEYEIFGVSSFWW